jgi:hypothetical protein
VVRKKWWRLLALIFGLILLALGGLFIWLWRWQKNITPAWVIAQVEKACDCRCDLDAVEVSLFSRPAHLRLTGLWLTPRDQSVISGLAPASRPRPVRKATYLCLESAEIQLDLWAWLSRQQLVIEKVTLRGADVRTDLLPKQGASLAQLFSRPAEGGGSLSPELAVLSTPAAAHAEPERTDDESTAAPAPETAPVIAGKPQADRPERAWSVPITVHHLQLTEGRARLRHQKNKTAYSLDKIDLQVRDFVLDPRPGAVRSGAHASLTAQFALESRKKKNHPTVDLSFTSETDWQFLDPQTARWSITASGPLTLQPGAVAREWPILQKLKKRLDKAQDAGLKIPDFSTTATLAQPAVLHWLWQDQRLQLTQPLQADFGDFSLSTQTATYLDFTDETHHVPGELALSENISQTSLAEVERFLQPLGTDAADSLRRLLIQPLVRGPQIVLPFESQGKISDPQVKTQDPVSTLKDQLKEGQNLLKDLLK